MLSTASGSRPERAEVIWLDRDTLSVVVVGGTPGFSSRCPTSVPSERRKERVERVSPKGRKQTHVRQRRNKVRRPQHVQHDHFYHRDDAVCPLVAPLPHLPTVRQVISNAVPVRDGMFKGTRNASFSVSLTPNYMNSSI